VSVAVSPLTIQDYTTWHRFAQAFHSRMSRIQGPPDIGQWNGLPDTFRFLTPRPWLCFQLSFKAENRNRWDTTTLSSHPTMEYKPPTMNTPNSRKPHKVERHAIQQVSTARNLLTDRGAALSRSKRDKADDLLD
jgi:hypothetical protein